MSAAAHRYPVVIISDLHLGMKGAAAEMLYEFLRHVHCDHLIINGDFIDAKHSENEFPEFHARVLDILNARIAGGMKATCIEGNHDLKMGPEAGDTVMGIRVAGALDFNDLKGRRLRITHGHPFAPQSFQGKFSDRFLEKPYELMMVFDHAVNRRVYDMTGRHFSLVNQVRDWLEYLTGLTHHFAQAAVNSVAGQKVQGIFCGHIHRPELKQIDGIIYGNSGDWVQNCTAMVMDDKGDWSHIHWRRERRNLGLTALPALTDPHPEAGFRDETEAMIRIFRGHYAGGLLPLSARPKLAQ